MLNNRYMHLFLVIHEHIYLNFIDMFVYCQSCHSSLKTSKTHFKRERYIMMFSSEINWFTFYKDKALKSQCRSPLME